jgi:hypothetical protein
MGYLVGIDIGGTFTDCAIVDRAGRLLTTKVPSTPQDFEVGTATVYFHAHGPAGPLGGIRENRTDRMRKSDVHNDIVVEKCGHPAAGAVDELVGNAEIKRR